MSGIAGIVHFDGAGVDRRLLRRMTDSMAVRGPDRQDIWLDGPVGFGHALLHTNEGTAGQQPTSLDGQVWITADARIDARTDLVRKLNARRSHPVGEENDAQLILHAYSEWGERCVDYLLGDFAFAIWDRRARRLFCARDRFGIKPFYYAEVPGAIVFSNTLACVRMHPAVGDGLNEIAVGDFLLFGLNCDPATTTFAHIRRLVAGHTLEHEQGAQRTRRYWTAPIDGRIRYRRSRDYVEHFKDLLTTAVADRLPAHRVDVWMSGGLDSTSITAIARDLLAKRDRRVDLHAHTVVYDTLFASDERHYARLAADALGVPIRFFAADHYMPFEGWDAGDVRTPEPTSDPFVLLRLQQLRTVASSNRVVLCGEGGDEVCWRSDLVDLVGTMPWRELAADITRSLALYGVRPAIGLRDRVKKWRAAVGGRFPLPAWLNGNFVDRTDLRQRFERVSSGEMTASHPVRAEAHRRLMTAPWAAYFESSDPGTTGVPVEIRYPFMDVRLVNYLLSIPPIPWFVAKTLLRETMNGVLPAPVLRRRKTPLVDDPLRVHLTAASSAGHKPLQPVPALAECVDHRAVPRLDGGCQMQDPWLDVRPYCLNHWLARLHA
jgi:asparagine synthase (glutamine-hydrolysing)